MDVSFINGKEGWILVKEGSSKGRSTYLYTTKNGGIGWYGTELQEGVPTKGLISFSDEENGWYVSQEGADLGSTFKELYRTVDGGITWRKYLWEEDILPPGGSIKALNFTSAMVGQLLMFNSGVMGPGFFNEPNLYETFDGGENWYPVNLGLKTPLSIGKGKEVKSQLEMLIYIDEVTGQAIISCRYTWEVGEEKREAFVIYRSDDEGVTWEQGEPLYYPSPLKTKLQSGFIKDLGIGWALIDYRLFVTYDLGQHWSLITNQLGQYNIIDVGFINQSQTYGVTNRGQVMFSEDGGITWSEQRRDKDKIALDSNESADRDTSSTVKIINKGYVNQVPQYYSNLALEDDMDYKATKYMQIYSHKSVTQHSQKDEVGKDLLNQFAKIREQGINLRGELYLSSYQGELQGELFLSLYNLPWSYYIKWTVEDINSLNLIEEASPYLTSPLIRGFDGTKELLSPLYPLFSWDGFYFVRKVFIQDSHNLIVEYVDKGERTGTYLAKTADGGKTWFPMMTFLNPIDGESPIIRSYFKDDIGYVLAEKQFTSGTRLVVYSTKDGGGTWGSTLLEANSNAYSAHFAYLSDEEIWILLGLDHATGHEPKELYRTANGGSSWESIAQTIPGKYTPDGPNGFGYPTGIYFRDTQVGFITALNHGTNDGSAIGDYQFQITKDGGLTWESSSPKAFNDVVKVSGGYGEVYPPVFSQEDPDLGVLLIEYKWMDKDVHKEAYVAMKTVDGGLTWQVGDTVDTSHTFLDEYYINSKGVSCLALGDGSLYKMEDWGLRFRELPKLKIQDYGLCAMKIMEDKIFVIERKGGIYAFNDNKESWEMVKR